MLTIDEINSILDSKICPVCLEKGIEYDEFKASNYYMKCLLCGNSAFLSKRGMKINTSRENCKY